jgi:stage II sporulation protein R
MAGFFKRNILDKAMILGAVICIVITAFTAFAEDCEEKPQEVLRLHILANSDSKDDQTLKYDLRDYMLSTFSDVFGNCDSFSQSVAVANERRAEIEEKANEFVHSKGYSYNVKCEVAKTYFTTRKYENVTLPAGEYTAVRLLIGNAEGRNWWCVMFPPLCLPAVTNIDEMMEECDGILTEEEFDMLQNPENYKAKFYIVELFNKMRKNNDG